MGNKSSKPKSAVGQSSASFSSQKDPSISSPGAAIKTRMRSLKSLSGKWIHGELGLAEPNRLAGLPHDVLAQVLFPMLSVADQRSLRLTGTALNRAFRSSRSLTLVVGDDSLRRLEAAIKAPGAVAVLPTGPDATALATLYPCVERLTLLASCRFAAVVCATPPILQQLLPPNLESLTLERWSLHDQALQLRTIGSACGPTLVSLELRDVMAVQDLPGLFTTSALGRYCSSLRTVIITASQAEQGFDRDPSTRPAAGADAADSGLPPAQPSTEWVSALVPRAYASRTRAGSGTRPTDPTLIPHAFRTLRDGTILSAASEWAKRTHRPWGSWHAAGNLTQQPGAVPPPITTLVLRCVTLSTGKELTVALEALQATLISLELIGLAVGHDPNSPPPSPDLIKPRHSVPVTLAVVSALPRLQRLRRLHLTTPGHHLPAWDGADGGNATVQLVEALQLAGRAEGGGGGCTLQLLRLPHAHLTLEQWQQITRGSTALEHLEVHSVYDYDGSLPPNLKRITMHRLELDDPDVTMHVQTWRKAPLECVELFMSLDTCEDDGEEEQQQQEGGPDADAASWPAPPTQASQAFTAARASEQLGCFATYCLALARVPRVCLGLAVRQGGPLGADPRSYHPTWLEVLEPLAAVGGLQQLLVVAAQPSSFTGEHMQYLATHSKGLRLLGVATPRSLGALRREEGFEAKLRMRLGDGALEPLMFLPHLRQLLLEINYARGGPSRKGVEALQHAYTRRFGRNLGAVLVVHDGGPPKP